MDLVCFECQTTITAKDLALSVMPWLPTPDPNTTGHIATNFEPVEVRGRDTVVRRAVSRLS